MSLPSTTKVTRDESDQAIDQLWGDATNQIMMIDPATENWKAQVLPLARIKKIMKSEEAILAELEQDKSSGGGQASNSSLGQRFMIAGEAPVLLGKACELLIREVTARSWRHTERCRRRTLQRQDVHAAVGESEVFDFLIDIIPRVAPTSASSNKSNFGEVTEQQQQHMGSANANIDATNLAVMQRMGDESGMSLADAELRMQQLQQMQEQFLMMQQRMDAQATVVGDPAVAARQFPQMQQAMMHPAMFLPPDFNGQWQNQGKRPQQQQQQQQPQYMQINPPNVAQIGNEVSKDGMGKVGDNTGVNRLNAPSN